MARKYKESKHFILLSWIIVRNILFAYRVFYFFHVNFLFPRSKGAKSFFVRPIARFSNFNISYLIMFVILVVPLLWQVKIRSYPLGVSSNSGWLLGSLRAMVLESAFANLHNASLRFSKHGKSAQSKYSFSPLFSDCATISISFARWWRVVPVSSECFVVHPGSIFFPEPGRVCKWS